MSRVYVVSESEKSTLERHTTWEREGGTGVYRRRLLVWRNFHRKYEPCDLLLFLDGQNLFSGDSQVQGRHWSAESRLENYDSPLLVVAVPASKRRYPEYIGWSQAPGHFSDSGERHALFLTQDVLNYARALHPRARLRGVVGASAGGVAALYAAWRCPGKIPAVACLSAGRHYFSELLDSFEGIPCPRVYLSCASRGMDAGFREQNREFAKRLRKRGAQVLLRLHQGDHSESTWGRRVPDVLRFLL